jgi:hypothetical protein
MQRTRHPLALVALLAVLLAACTGATPTPTVAFPSGPSPTSTPTPTPGPALTVPQLKLALIRAMGPLWYCDRDFWPLQRGEEIDRARERWAEVASDAVAFGAILADQGIAADTAVFTDAQRLAVYQAWKVLAAIALEPGKDGFTFDYLAHPSGDAGALHTLGTISPDGRITVTSQQPGQEPICPICLARGTRVETPGGPVAVEALRIGDAAWTLDEAGRRIPGTIVATGSTAAPDGHRVVHLVLVDGRSVTASPGHPLADGRPLGSLVPGDVVDGSAVVTADLLPYTGGETFDIVVAGGTGVYLVDGIALGSTLLP